MHDPVRPAPFREPAASTLALAPRAWSALSAAPRVIAPFLDLFIVVAALFLTGAAAGVAFVAVRFTALDRWVPLSNRSSVALVFGALGLCCVLIRVGFAWRVRLVAWLDRATQRRPFAGSLVVADGALSLRSGLGWTRARLAPGAPLVVRCERYRYHARRRRGRVTPRGTYFTGVHVAIGDGAARLSLLTEDPRALDATDFPEVAWTDELPPAIAPAWALFSVATVRDVLTALRPHAVFEGSPRPHATDDDT